MRKTKSSALALSACLTLSSAASGQSPAGFFVNPNSPPSPDLSIDFVGNFSPQGNISSVLTTSRNSIKTCDDLNGYWHQVPANVLCYSNKGALIEESRTNSIRNNTMTGAATGTPGTPPTNWVGPTYTANQGTLATQITAISNQNGIAYIGLRLFGTPAGAGTMQLRFEANTQIVATQNQTWTGSVYESVIGGTTTNISSFSLSVRELGAAGAFIADFPVVFNPGNGLSTLGASRSGIAATLNNASTAFVSSLINISYSAAVATDVTIAVGWPQLELGSFATSPIPTTNAAVTRAVDLVKATNLPATIGTSRTLFARFLDPPAVASGATAILDMSTDGNNRDDLFVASATGKNASGNTLNAASNLGRVDSATPYVLGQSAKAAYVTSPSSRFVVANGVVGGSSTNTGSPPVSQILIGAQGGPTNYADTYIQQIQLWANQALTPAQLQVLTSP